MALRGLNEKAERVQQAVERQRRQQQQFSEHATYALLEMFKIAETRLLADMQAEEDTPAQQDVHDDEGEAVPLLRLPEATRLNQYEYPKGLSPPVMPMLRNICLGDKREFVPFLDRQRGGVRYTSDQNRFDLLHPEETPINLRNARANGQQLDVWAKAGTLVDLVRLDSMMWEIITIAAVGFNLRTKHRSVDERFLLLNRDYFDWRGINPQSVTPGLRQDVDDRLQVLFRAQIHTETALYVTDPATRRKTKMNVVASGPFLVEIERYDRAGRQGRGPPYGYLVTLGEWARKMVEEKAMLGVYPRQLATYHGQRQQWAQRIGGYLVFQWQNQGSKMRFYEEDGIPKAIPQQPLKLRTVLDRANLDWESLRAHDPGRVIENFINSLERLKQDGILAHYECLNGPADGKGLPRKGKLDRMLGYRFMFYPGPELVRHLRPKAEGAQAKTARRKASLNQKA